MEGPKRIRVFLRGGPRDGIVYDTRDGRESLKALLIHAGPKDAHGAHVGVYVGMMIFDAVPEVFAHSGRHGEDATVNPTICRYKVVSIGLEDGESRIYSDFDGTGDIPNTDA